jgi:hypothetical protein
MAASDLQVIRWAAVAGLSTLALTLPLTFADSLLDFHLLTYGNTSIAPVYIALYMAGQITISFFTYGLAVLGRDFELISLRAAAFVTIAAHLLGLIVLIAVFFQALPIELASALDTPFTVIHGLSQLLTGLGLLKLRSALGPIAIAAGVAGAIWGLSTLADIGSAVGLSSDYLTIPYLMLGPLVLLRATQL